MERFCICYAGFQVVAPCLSTSGERYIGCLQLYYARSLEKISKQLHLTCGVLYWYIHSGSDEEPGFLVFLALSTILFPVSGESGESGDLYII